jgi:hypothetical protein
VTATSAATAAQPPTSADPLRDGEELLLARAGAWRVLVPLRYVARVHGAAMPAARPGARPETPVVAVDGRLVPVAFAAALLGADEVRLAPEHQLLELGSGGARALLWVDAVEEVVEHVPAAGPAGGAGALLAGYSGAARPLAVLDVPALLALLTPAVKGSP